MGSVLKVANASLAFGEQAIWSDLNFEVQPGEFIAIIGANGSGKSMLLKSILGQQALTSGSIELLGKKAGFGSRKIGYIPQHRILGTDLPLRVIDAVRFGLDGHKFGLPIPSKSMKSQAMRALEAVDAEHLADKPVGQLSGGEMQRVRVAQAVISKPSLVLADEPLSALDLHHQGVVSELIHAQASEQKAAVLFVTHDVNPIIDYVDRVLYLAQGNYSIGTPDEVLRSEVLSKLYGSEIDVVRNQGRVVVLGTHDHNHHQDEEWS
ncbi:MAG: metal ABC transporter ATP-binding protein [Aquiluna sp.]|nr:metal ABC transporter ATP-binding protein [Aquiluna sp.]MCF8545729.1 metal ABC transporter ATP-binding protein [Aquiluna sp.]